MNTDHSKARATYGYQPTIIESRVLLSRLAIQVSFFNQQLKRSWIDLKRDPATFLSHSTRSFLRHAANSLSAPNVMPAGAMAILTVVVVVLLALFIDQRGRRTVESAGNEYAQTPEVVMLNVSKPAESNGREARIGKDGPGRVGFQNNKGEGSGTKRQQSGGGGGGGNGNPIPPQVGKIPLPSFVQAAIPIVPPINPPSLPVAGIDVDPTLWKDLTAPVYGDPRSKSDVPSKGPGEGEGIGTIRGQGIGRGEGPGVGPGKDGGMGGGPKQPGCCGPGGGADNPDGRPYVGTEVEQRARLIYKPEPQYTEEARKNQITGTVRLRVVFSSAGDVVQIRAVNTLPFGLTERAIAAARQIKFMPATKGGRPVSVFMQLEYNFNLY